MGPTTEEIETHIEIKQADLRSNLEELEDRVKSMADWRRHFRRNPGVALGVAFTGGLVLSSMLGGGGARGAAPHQPRDAHAREEPPRQRPILQAWENIRGALVGVAASKVADTLSEVVPGFREHLARGTGAGGNGVQGEGDYRAARRCRNAAENLAHTADVERAARRAAPRTEAESVELAEAEAIGRARAKPS